MTKEEYRKRMDEDNEWAPGWDAIEAEFDRLYPGKEPAHYGTEIHARAIFGGDNYLDGYSLYDSGEGYQHIVTFGMSELYTDEEAFGGEYSRWGYEMTIKLKEEKAEGRKSGRLSLGAGYAVQSCPVYLYKRAVL